MPTLVEGKLLPSQVAEAFTVLAADGPEIPMTFDEVTEWLRQHVLGAPSGRDGRKRQGYSAPAGRPGRMVHRTRVRSAA